MDPCCKQHGCYMFKDGPERAACEKNCRLEQRGLLRNDRLVYGNSFELDGVRIDPRRVVLHADGTYTLTPEKGLTYQGLYPEAGDMVWYNGAGGPHWGVVVQYAEGHIELCTGPDDIVGPGQQIIVTEVFPSRLAALESKMPEMWPRWKDDETRSELGSTGIEVIKGNRDRYGEGWWVIDNTLGDKPSEKAVDWYRDRVTAKERAEDVYNARMQKIQLDGLRLKRAMGLPEGTIWERMEKIRKGLGIPGGTAWSHWWNNEDEPKRNPFYNEVLGVPFEVTNPCPRCGSQVEETKHLARCTNRDCNWRPPNERERARQEYSEAILQRLHDASLCKTCVYFGDGCNAVGTETKCETYMPKKEEEPK